MDKPKTTPKDFFLWAGAMLSLYISVISLIALLFNYINYVFPNALSYMPDPYAGGVPYEMAALIVLLPTFLILMRLIRTGIRKDPSRSEIWVRRWALFLTLFAAGATIVIDLIVLLHAFLSGEELTVRFLLKVAIVLLVTGAGFMHFLADLRGYWMQFPQRAQRVGWGVAVLVIIAIAAGFFIIGTPQHARSLRLDHQKINDLENIQYQIVNYWQLKQALPASLTDLNNPLNGSLIPVDSQTGKAYEYKSTGALSFELCATFNEVGAGDSSMRYPVPMPVGAINSDVSSTWQHDAGHACFERTIDPELYPPVKK